MRDWLKESVPHRVAMMYDSSEEMERVVVSMRSEYDTEWYGLCIEGVVCLLGEVKSKTPFMCC
jgi:hypothetical protein